MHEDNLPVLRRTTLVSTNDSNNDHTVYANLEPGL